MSARPVVPLVLLFTSALAPYVGLVELDYDLSVLFLVMFMKLFTMYYLLKKPGLLYLLQLNNWGGFYWGRGFYYREGFYWG